MDYLQKPLVPLNSSLCNLLSKYEKMPSLYPSLRSLSKLALVQLACPSVLGGSPPTCTNPQTSCQNSTAVSDTCCFNAPGGQLLQTQFWDSSPATGPSDSWTVHGLWPDHCDGTYDANCDASRAYTNITQILQAAGKTDLLSYMNTYWKDVNGNDESFWEHEWGKHGTCISTLEPKCYTDYTPQEEVPDFFQKTVDLFKTLNSYQFLSDAGITPSSTTTYTSADILAALKKPRGVDVAIQCENTNELDEIWYFFDVAGSVQTGTFIPSDPDGSKSSCPATGVKYLPKSGSSSPPTTTTTTTTRGGPTTSPGTPFNGKGTLQVTTSGKADGCIISAGTWYTTGTCATFTAAASGSGFTLTSSKGKCGVVNNVLTCGSSVSSATVFSNSNGNLAYNSSPSFYASSVPTGSTQAAVSTSQEATSLTITWKSS